MMCARCDKTIKPGEGKVYEIEGNSGAGYTVNVHATPCTRPPQPRTYSYSPTSGH